jgi:ATP-binding cassette, subfamily B, bacterial
MSQATEPAWRGIAAEEAEEIPPSLATFLRLRSRRLLADMLRPHRRASLVILVLIVIANVAALVGPWLVGVGVDEVPQLTKTHDAVPLTLVVIGFGVAVVVQALTTRAYISAIGRMGGKVVLELRRRLFGHFQALPISTRFPTCSKRAWTPWYRPSSPCCSWGPGCCCSTGPWRWS